MQLATAAQRRKTLDTIRGAKRDGKQVVLVQGREYYY